MPKYTVNISKLAHYFINVSAVDEERAIEKAMKLFEKEPSLFQYEEQEWDVDVKLADKDDGDEDA